MIRLLFLLLLLPAGLFLVLPSSRLSAQADGGTFETLFRLEGTYGGDQLGFSIAAGRDLDGDGVTDLVAGAPRSYPYGAARAFSGANGGLLWNLNSLKQGEFGEAVAILGDLDGDGLADVAVGNPSASPGDRGYAGSVFLVSGATGRPMDRLDGPVMGDYFGSRLAPAGDVDGDGVPDLLVGAIFADPNGIRSAGSAFVFSGATRAQLFRFDGSEPQDFLGNAVSTAGDLDGDGHDDLLIGALSADPGGLTFAGSAFVFSGATGAQLFRFDGADASDLMGSSVASAGDLDGDGVPDLLVAARGSDPQGIVNAGSVLVFSGASGAVIRRFDGTGINDFFGSSVASAGDADGDGVPDLLIGANRADPGGRTDAGSVFLYSGATGKLIFRFDGSDAGKMLGDPVAGAGDLDGDGSPELFFGIPRADVGDQRWAGTAVVFTFNPILDASAETFSVAAGGAVDYSIDFPDADAGREYGLLLSATGTGPTLFKGLPIPLTNDRFFRASLTGNTPPQGIGFQGILDPQGRSQARFAAPPGTLPGKLIGRTFFLAAVNDKLDFASVARKLAFLP